MNAPVSVPAQSQQILPQARYHPTIQTQTCEERPPPKTTTGPNTRPGQTRLRTRPDTMHPPHKNNTEQVSAGKPQPGVAKQKQNHCRVPRTASDSGLPQKQDHIYDRVLHRLEDVPPGLGVQLGRSVVEEVEALTRGQRTNQDWFSWRKNRITASVAHRIAHCRFVNGKTRTPPASYLAAVTGDGNRVQTRAMSWGISMEAEAIRRYQNLKMVAQGQMVSVQDCGLFIDPQRPWLAASPDGIVIESQTGKWLRCLEVKCPYKHRHRRVEDACREDPAFCLEIQSQEPRGSPVYHLKTSHSYFTQIQCQLAVTGLQHADLVVHTTKEMAVVPVTFDPDLWEETVAKLEVFYRGAVLPHLRERTERGAAAAWTPEL